MKLSIFPLLLASAASLSAVPLTDVTQPSDPIQVVNGVNDGDSFGGGSPISEVVEKAIDDVTTTKYLNFLDLGSGLAVQPAIGPTIVTVLRLTTANDAKERDPASFVLSGGNSLAGPWTPIASGPLALSDSRFTASDVPFANSTPYLAYQLIFPTLKDSASANSMQIGEVELLGIAVSNGGLPSNGGHSHGVPDTGSTAAFFGLALAGMAGLRKRLA